MSIISHRDCRGRDFMVVGYTTTCHGKVHSIKLCDQFCQSLAIGRWFFPGTPVSSTKKTYCHERTEILSTVALNTITHLIPYVISDICQHLKFVEVFWGGGVTLNHH